MIRLGKSEMHNDFPVRLLTNIANFRVGGVPGVETIHASPVPRQVVFSKKVGIVLSRQRLERNLLRERESLQDRLPRHSLSKLI